MTVAGVRSPFLARGSQADDEAVVFLHGNPGSALDWADLVGRVGGFARAIALDMPGFGRAGRSREFEYTVGGYARHLAGALDQLAVRRAHLVLHDFGGAWGLSWAAAHPDRVGSVTVINSGILPDYRWHLIARLWRTPVVGELVLAASTRRVLSWSLRRTPPRGLPAWFADQTAAFQDRGTRRAVRKLYRATDDPAGMSRALAAVLRPLDLPALVVWGKQDPFLPEGLAIRQREAFPHARVEILEGSGHWPHIDDPDRVGQIVVPFWRGQLRR